VLSFLNSASIVILLGAEFLGISFIIIYVGAISILFLFVIMMLNSKNHKLFFKLEFLFLFLFLFICFILVYFCSNFIFFDFEFDFSDFFVMFVFDPVQNIEILGQVLFNYFNICFLLAGLILLVSMIGAIVVTLSFAKNKKIQDFKQLSRSQNFIRFF